MRAMQRADHPWRMNASPSDVQSVVVPLLGFLVVSVGSVDWTVTHFIARNSVDVSPNILTVQLVTWASRESFFHKRQWSFPHGLLATAVFPSRFALGCPSFFSPGGGNATFFIAPVPDFGE